MKDILQVTLGAIIALIGSYLTYHATLKTAISHEESLSQRTIDEIKARKTLNKLNFDQQIILNNRECIPDASQKILYAVINLFDISEKLVANYPGAPVIRPDLLFTNTITHLNHGFPESLQTLEKLTSEWNKLYTRFNKVTANNALFMSTDIKTTLNTFSQKSDSIKTYFYGYYEKINTNETFKQAKIKFNATPFTDYLHTKTFGDDTHDLLNGVLNDYTNLIQLRKTLQTKITKYTQETTNIGKTN